MAWADVAAAAAGIVLMAWLPGRAWLPLLLPRAARGLEGFVLSVGLSVAMMTLGLYAANVLLGVRLGAASALWLSLALTLAGFGARAGRRLDERLTRALETAEP